MLLFCVLPLLGQAQRNETEWQRLINNRQYAEVIKQVGSLTAADSADFQVMYTIGQAYEGLLRYRNANRFYAYCYQLDTTNVDLLNTLARTAIHIGKGAEAETLFHRVLVSDSLNFYANYQLARLYSQMGEYEKAVQKYTFFIAHNEENPALLSGLGDCYSKLEQPLPATSSYFLAYNYNRENVGLANTLINSMLRMGVDYAKEALAICDTALYYNPGNRPILRSKGMALYMNRDYAEADTLYTALMEAGDSTYLTLKYGGVSRYQAGQFYRAVEPLEAAYLLDTTSVDVCLFLGSALGKTYDRQRAFALFDRAEENLQPPAAYLTQLKLFRAETYQKDGQRQKAEKLYYELWFANPDKIDYLAQIDRMYSGDIFQIENEVTRQRALYIQILYIQKLLENENAQPELLLYKRRSLEKTYNEMFFRQQNELPMLSPAGKKQTISILEVRELLNRLPEESTL